VLKGRFHKDQVHPNIGHEDPEREYRYNCSFFNLVLDAVSAQRHALALLPRERDRVPVVQEAGWPPVPVWTVAENLAPTGI
jgi:hypothetical protein